MKFLSPLRCAFKFTNLTYPYKNSLNYASVAIGGLNNAQKRFASKTSGGELNGDECFQEAFAVLSLLRDNSRQVELLPDNLEKYSEKQSSIVNCVISAKDSEKSDTNIPHEFRSGMTPKNSASNVPANSAKEIKSVDLSFETEMMNLKKSLLNPSHLLKSENLKESTFPFFTNKISETKNTTIPLHFNTLINGTVDNDPMKNLEQNPKATEFNEYLMSLAANLCSSAAMQSGFPSETSRKHYCTKNAIDFTSVKTELGDKKKNKVKQSEATSEEIVKDLLNKHDEFRNGANALFISSIVAGKDDKDNKRDPHIVCVGDEKKGCISPGNKENAPYYPKKATDERKETKGHAKSGLGLLDPQLYKKSLKEAENKRKELAKASASCKEKLSLRACQSKKSTTDSKTQKCSDMFPTSKCNHEMESIKNFESLTEPSSPFKCGSKKPVSKCGSEEMASKKLSKGASSACTSEPTDSLSAKPYESKITKTASTCSSEAQKYGSLPQQISIKSDTPKSPEEKYAQLSKTETKSKKCKKSVKETEVLNCSSKPEPKSQTTLKCSSKSELKLEDPCKIPPIKKSVSCGSSTESQDPCKVPSITFKKPEQKSSSVSKQKCGASKQKDPTMPNKSTLASNCSLTSKQKCISKLDKSVPASKCSSEIKKSTNTCKTPSETTVSKCSSACSSNNSCVKPKKEPDENDSNKACKRVAMDAKKSCETEPKNPCKSSCDSMKKPKSNCGRPPKGDTRPRCKKDSKCGSKKPSPCASKEQPKSKCVTETKPPEKPPKCESKTCAPSPKTSETDIKSKSKCSSGQTKPKTSPSLRPSKRSLHSFSNFSMPALIFSRNFSDDCPEKPKGGYKLESERSDEYRRETCENFSWNDTKSRKKRTNKPKNCYPDETQEFCPDTACYKVYAETSGKANKKTVKKNPKANKMDKNEALCTRQIIMNPIDYHKRHHSSQTRENEEALIQKPHSICTRRLALPSEISDNDALISIDSVALSDCDIHMFETGGRHTPDLTIGNEAAGIVTEVGRNICNLKTGDHVVLESGVPCFKCDLCKMGRYNICNNINFKGFLKNCCVHPASFCHKICPPIPLEQAALIPQLAIGCNACYQAGIKPNSNVVIIGSCARTVCAAMCAISMGAENIFVLCEMPETRILIEQFVTEKVNCFSSNTIEIGMVRMILASLGTLPDIVINFSANTKTMNTAVMALKPAGVCTVGGFLSECVSFNIMDTLKKELRIIPSFRSKNMFPKAIHLLESGRAPLECLIANCELCKWNELESAFKLALSESNNGPRKAIVKCQLSD